MRAGCGPWPLNTRLPARVQVRVRVWVRVRVRVTLSRMASSSFIRSISRRSCRSCDGGRRAERRVPRGRRPMGHGSVTRVRATGQGWVSEHRWLLSPRRAARPTRHRRTTATAAPHRPSTRGAAHLVALDQLLAPLPATHLRAALHGLLNLSTAAQPQHQVQGRLLLDVVIREGAAVLELFAREYQALLVGRDALPVLDLGLDVLDPWLDLERDRLACKRAYTQSSGGDGADGSLEIVHTQAIVFEVGPRAGQGLHKDLHRGCRSTPVSHMGECSGQGRADESTCKVK